MVEQAATKSAPYSSDVRWPITGKRVVVYVAAGVYGSLLPLAPRQAVYYLVET